MKKFFGLMVSIGLIVCGCYLLYRGVSGMILDDKNDPVPLEDIIKQPMSPGEPFEIGKYIEVDGVEILYDGRSFLVTNTRTDMVRVMCSIVGAKKDGSYDTIQYASFGGVDKTRYERDKSENGWAIEQFTNLIRPGETLEATLDVFDFDKFDNSYPKNDIDNDGYLDLVFTISPQVDETSIRSSSTDIKSDIYKIEDKQ